MGIEKQKKNGWFFSSSEGGGHPEYITAIFLLVFPQAGVWEGLIACNEFWNDSLTLWAVGLSCGMCLERRTGHIYLYKEIHPQLVILASGSAGQEAVGFFRSFTTCGPSCL